MANTLKVLLVEDDETLRTLYKEAFTHNNFEVFEAEDGQRAIDAALEHRPDMILLDLLLPRQGGLAALRILRSIPETQHTPVFILTAMPNPEYQETAKNRAQGYFLKTQITPQALVDKVRQYLEKDSHK